MDFIKLGDCDYRFMNIVWEHSPVKSGELVKICEEQLGWKKSTTYTIIKKMGEKGLLKNEQATVTALISKEKVQKAESEYFVERTFNGSLPQFVAAFLGGKKLSRQDAAELKSMIEQYEED